MNSLVWRNVALLLGLAAAGAICVMAAPALMSPRGMLGPTVLQAYSSIKAEIAVVIVLALSTVVAIVIARLTNTAVGLFVLGTGITILAMRLATIREIAFGSVGSSSRTVLLMVALESLLWAIAILGAVLVVFKLGGALRDIEPLKPGIIPHPIWSREALMSAAAGIVVLPAVWIVAQSPMKGQLLGAVFLGSLLAGLIGRLASPNVQPVLLFISPIVFGAIGHAVAAFALKQPLDVAYSTGHLPNLSLPMPIDYAAGSLIGVSMGLGWAKSFLHHEDDPNAAAAHSAA